MPFVRFQELKVYILAEELADAIWDIVEKWGALARDTVGKQIVRSADSVAANIAEGAGQGSRAGNRRHVCIARGSFNETQHWLRRAYRRNLLTDDEIASLQSKIEKLGPKLSAYLSSFSRSSTKTTPVTKEDEDN